MSNFETQGSFPIEELLPGGSPAKTSQWPESVPDWLVDVLASSGRSFALVTNYDRDGSSSKTCLVSCRVTTDGILESSSGPWLNSGTASRGASWMHSSSEFRNVDVACSLSDVLETTGEHLARYSLSPKACEGILRRATRRGRTLPTLLQVALEAVAQMTTPLKEATSSSPTPSD